MKKLIVFIYFLAAVLSYSQTIHEGLDFEITDEQTVTITKYTGNAAEVTIPEQINDLPVTVIGFGAFSSCSSLTDIDIPSTVTSNSKFYWFFCVYGM
jgi:hypothetical protein